MMRHIIALLGGLILMIFIAAAGSTAAGTPTGMFDLYEQNRKENIPNYITEDFLLLTYGMLLNDAVTHMEEAVLYPRFTALVEGLLKKEIGSGEIAAANRDFLSVLNAVLSGAEKTQGAARPKVADAELARVLKAGGIDRSGLMDQRIDYTQFTVRGKYTRSEALRRYFRAMKYAGLVLFPVKESKATGISAETADRLTGQAVALVKAVMEDDGLREHYKVLTDSLAWLFGPADDMTLEDYHQVAGEHPKAAPKALRKALFAYAKENDRRPVIIGGIVDVRSLGTDTARDVLTGFRFLPQRFTPGSAAFQQLVYPAVGKYQGDSDPFSMIFTDGKKMKGFPLALELMALMGSTEAGDILKKTGNRNYEGYDAAAEKASAMLTIDAGMASDHFDMMRYWLVRGETLQKKNDPDRRLNTCLGFWTYTRYINLLYVKQSTTGVGKGIELAGQNGERKTAWLEPTPELYLHLERQVRTLTLKIGSEDASMSDTLNRFADLLTRCRGIALNEIAGKPMAAEDAVFLNGLDKTLLKLVGEKDQPIVVDVHTEPNTGEVLEEALGYPQAVTCALKDGKARGALFRYYEFRYPMDSRLTDEDWRVLLEAGDPMDALVLSPGSTASE